MVVTGGEDFAIGFRCGALKGVAEQQETSLRRPSPLPYIWRVRSHWTRTTLSGRCSARNAATLMGPADIQTEIVQRLRGPYKGENNARREATKHSNEN
jgi:hypothetical protein